MEIEGACLCGSVRWGIEDVPESATACNCTACRRYGALWAYGFEDEGIHISGTTRAYVRGTKTLEFRFCPDCGCVAYWCAREPGEDGRRYMAVNLRLAEPDAIAAVPILQFEGLDTFENLPRDGRCVADIWF